MPWRDLIGPAQAMVGVFISVTTVPAAGNLALAAALGVGHEVAGSAQQLGLTVAGMLLAGSLTLSIQRLAMKRVSRVMQPLLAQHR